MRAVTASNADLVFVCAYPPDTVGIVRAVQEIGLSRKDVWRRHGRPLATPIKMQLGPLMNGIVIMESFVPAPNLSFPGLKSHAREVPGQGAGAGIDPLGYGFMPFGYAAGQVLAQAVEGTKSLDHSRLADYMHAHAFPTVAGEIAFGKDGEWTKSRQFFTQFQGVSGNDLDSIPRGRAPGDPVAAEYKTGNLIYPYQEAKAK